MRRLYQKVLFGLYVGLLTYFSFVLLMVVFPVVALQIEIFKNSCEIHGQESICQQE